MLYQWATRALYKKKVIGIEPIYLDYEANILPLNYTFVKIRDYFFKLKNKTITRTKPNETSIAAVKRI
jgi:hypothetical protein